MEAQLDYGVRLGWGVAAAGTLAPHSDIVIVVDVLSFSTSVDIAVSRGASVYAFRYRDERAGEFATRMNATFEPDRSRPRSLSPSSMQGAEDGDRIVLASPNGAEVTLASRDSAAVMCGCLRNAGAVAAAASGAQRVSVVAAGERWPDGSIRPAIEDLAGAAGILAALGGVRSPEAEAAVRWMDALDEPLADVLRRSCSAEELIHRGYATDVELALDFGCSQTVPLLDGGAYSAA